MKENLKISVLNFGRRKKFFLTTRLVIFKHKIDLIKLHSAQLLNAKQVNDKKSEVGKAAYDIYQEHQFDYECQALI